MAEIIFRSVGKRFRRAVVVTGLDLTIQSGEFFTFVGPSGCGKSTLLNMIAGLEHVDQGTISFDGTAVNEVPPGERDVAMVFQSYALYPHMTVYENLAFPLRVRKEPQDRIDGEVRHVAELLGLEALAGRRPRELSGGQRQRVALGRALIRRPRVFLMDEPLSNLDARLRIEMRAELKRLHREFPVTTVYVTHDQEEAMVLSDRIAVLKGGEIQQCGRPMEVYEKPGNLFVAGFIGSPPMQIFAGDSFGSGDLVDRSPGSWSPRGAIVGVRPSDVVVSADGKKGGLEMEVVLVEATGADTWVDGLWKGKTVKGRADGSVAIAPGTKAFFSVAPERLHFFDKESGKRISV